MQVKKGNFFKRLVWVNELGCEIDKKWFPCRKSLFFHAAVLISIHSFFCQIHWHQQTLRPPGLRVIITNIEFLDSMIFLWILYYIGSFLWHMTYKLFKFMAILTAGSRICWKEEKNALVEIQKSNTVPKELTYLAFIFRFSLWSNHAGKSNFDIAP